MCLVVNGLRMLCVKFHCSWLVIVEDIEDCKVGHFLRHRGSFHFWAFTETKLRPKFNLKVELQSLSKAENNQFLVQKLLTLHNWVLSPTDNVLMSVGHFDHVLLTVYSSMEHVTWKSPGPIPCVAKLVGSCVPIHAHRCLPDPECFNTNNQFCWVQTH